MLTQGRLCICDAMRNSVQFAQYKKREKHPWQYYS